ncbi:MAG TPA: MATE family efflux transporter [Anaerolineaceae bacterium]|nr:MATE family efflux transporter [Anaerolineaceae bacterium]
MNSTVAQTGKNPSFYRALFVIALPIIFQNFFSSSLNLVDTAMLGQLGETTVAAVGLANQIFFLLIFVLFGISSGAAVFTAQLWGKRDIPAIRKVLGLCLGMGLAGGLLFTIIALFIPEAAISVYSQDPAVIAAGSGYLRIVGFSYLFTAITFSYASVLRSTGNVRLPMFISIFSIALKTLLNIGLIFGNFGLPQLGILGAALATVIARFIECALLILLAYRMRTPVAARPREMLGFDKKFVRAFLAISLPVVFNETLWALGISAYSAVYGHIGTESIAAVNIASSIEGLAFALFIGISDACGILVGNKIGEGNEDIAFDYARRTLRLAISGAILMGGLILVGSNTILSIYKVSAESMLYARNILTVMAFIFWVRISNMTLIVGVLRSGGDTRFGFIMDAGTMWVIGVPTALISAFIFHLEVHWVYLIIMSEEMIKFFIAWWRFRSRRWIHNVAKSVATV